VGGATSFTIEPNSGLPAGTYTETLIVSGNNVTPQSFDVTFEVTPQQTYYGGPSSPTTYTVTFNSNGGSMVSSASVASGGKVTKPADPTRDGYTLAGWYTDAACLTPYDFTKNVTGSFILYAKWRAANPFKDVQPATWYYDAALDMHDRGIMNGTGSDTFDPNGTLTRAMIVTILYRLEGEPSIAGLANPFTDVPEGQWYTDAVKWGASKNIVLGYGNGKFGPNDPVLKEQLAALIYRLQQSSGKTPPDVLMDYEWPDWDKISDWAKSAVNALTMQGLFRDIPDTNFNPKKAATRAEIASILYCYLTAVE
jgi:uncharacterized repeat protein (TIGR02543 family)